ncbi:unnamed protein product [Rhizoctonia solani]|uniref:Nudix hydrolase domain-containing protein n=1 Tax=Rhizoctonia solani TaxID=456999 RepID=A0A8H3HEN1_9AGAM|nr:unnamed protein product [Rhizoctonia solani]
MDIPGIPPLHHFTITSEGHQQGYELWRTGTALKRFTNAFVFDPAENKVLLGLKKRGFGKGIYNGFGGKLDPGETVADAALRELQIRSDEMRPEWFAYPSLSVPSAVPSNTLPAFPYELMWKDDPLWMPHLLKSEYFVARVDYGPVPIPKPGQKVEPVLDGTAYLVDGERVEAGMQKWVCGVMDKQEWERARVWEA